ncbi:protein JINGUBANG [Vigna unguiculata]|uniref:WD40 repeat n=1 Tax=Vigna unguiculata TaxID=3917 RepID=A0A4D6LRF7_VIGUN|nr:protein JINGUBANG [Vigna unguiculata]QCD90564.1 WD40 repeat [Vigna unguiculata]
MGLLQHPLCCNSQQQQPQNQRSYEHFHSEPSTSSSLHSQPSLPSVPSLSSLTPQQPHNPQQQQPQTTVKIHSSPISSLVLHGKLLYSAASSGEVKTCSRDPFTLQTDINTNTNTNTNVVVVATTNAPIKSLIVYHDTLFTAHQDHKIRVWKADQPTKCIATLPTLHDRVSKLFSSKNYVEVRRHKKRTWVHHVDAVSTLALSHDGSLLYSASWDRTFKIWRTSDFKCLESVQNAHEDAINSLVLSNDGAVYTGSADTKIKMWKKREGEKKHSLVGTLEKHKSAVNALALSEDGSVLYSGACDRSILVWESDDNNMVVVGALRGHTKAILCLVVMADLVCSGSADNSVRVWRKEIGKGYSCLAVLEGHRRPVKCLAMAVDSNTGGGPHEDDRSYLVYSAGLDCDIKVWQIRVPLLSL